MAINEEVLSRLFDTGLKSVTKIQLIYMEQVRWLGHGLYMPEHRFPIPSLFAEWAEDPWQETDDKQNTNIIVISADVHQVD